MVQNVLNKRFINWSCASEDWDGIQDKISFRGLDHLL